ncbi:MAG TPA: hypothetical protein VFU40_10600 [Gemmatimonadales bacterium]|nr:hypothetical protein [Gemmatimonadales bacterium]
MPARLEAFSGDGQEGTVGSRLDDPLVVRLTDGGATPVAGTAVEFRFQDPLTDAKLDPANAETDPEGLAEAKVRLGTSTGPLTVEARVVSATQLSTTFGLTALAREKGKDKGKGNNDDEGSEDD